MVPRSSSRSQRKSISRPYSECGVNVVFGCDCSQAASVSASTAIMPNDASRRRREFPLIPDPLAFVSERATQLGVALSSGWKNSYKLTPAQLDREGAGGLLRMRH